MFSECFITSKTETKEIIIWKVDLITLLMLICKIHIVGAQKTPETELGDERKLSEEKENNQDCSFCIFRAIIQRGRPKGAWSFIFTPSGSGTRQLKNSSWQQGTTDDLLKASFLKKTLESNCGIEIYSLGKTLSVPFIYVIRKLRSK